ATRRPADRRRGPLGGGGARAGAGGTVARTARPPGAASGAAPPAHARDAGGGEPRAGRADRVPAADGRGGHRPAARGRAGRRRGRTTHGELARRIARPRTAGLAGTPVDRTGGTGGGTRRPRPRA